MLCMLCHVFEDSQTKNEDSHTKNVYTLHLAAKNVTANELQYFSNKTDKQIEIYTLRYYATFKVRKFESLFYKINTFLQKTTTCIGLQVEQIFPVNI